MVLLELYWSFLLIGFSSFGGLSMIPQISDQVLSHGWMTAEQVTDIVAIAEMTPGPLGLNCASFAGMQAAGIPGAIAANLGVLTPTLTLCALAAVFFNRFRDGKLMQRILLGVRPACLGLVIAVVVEKHLPERVEAQLRRDRHWTAGSGAGGQVQGQHPTGHPPQRGTGTAAVRGAGNPHKLKHELISA